MGPPQLNAVLEANRTVPERTSQRRVRRPGMIRTLPRGIAEAGKFGNGAGRDDEIVSEAAQQATAVGVLKQEWRSGEGMTVL